MTVRMFYEPKDPRILSNEDTYISDIEEEDDEKDSKPRKRKTGTQALVEFLNNTSPEEFQKTSTTLKTTFFFHRKKATSKGNLLPTRSKPTSIPHLLLYRKNYIEILANPFLVKRRDSTQKRVERKSSVSSSFVSSSLMLESEGDSAPMSKYRNNPDLLLQLPPKGMLQGVPTHPTTTRSPYNTDELSRRAKRTSQDIIEEALLQRLVGVTEERPNDFISKVLAQEHLQALSASLQHDTVSDSKRVRHMQVQTTPMTEPKPKPEVLEDQSVMRRLDQLELELKREKLTRQRLEAALEDACAHFEVLSAVAYKKIRELWEDRTRWEQACLQVKEQCWSEHQQHILGGDGGSSNGT